MTTRVQKGGTIFRPVAKAKARSQSTTISRQTSVISDAFPQSDIPVVEPHPNVGPTLGSMLPPPIDHGVRRNQTNLAVPNLAIYKPSTDSSFPNESRLNSSNEPTLPMPPTIARASNNAPPTLLISPPSIINLPGPSFSRTAFTIPVPGASQPTEILQSFNTSSQTSPMSVIPREHVTMNLNGLGIIPAVPTAGQLPSAGNINDHGEPSHTQQELPEGRNSDDVLNEPSASSPPKKSSRRKTSSEAIPKRLPRKRKASSSVASGNDDQPEERPAQRRRRKSKSGDSAPRSRKTRSPSLPSFDANADPGEDLDPTTITMAALCSDTGQGRISSKAAEIQTNFATWRTQSREKRARMRALAEAKKYGRDEEELPAAEAPADPSQKSLPASLPQPPAASLSSNQENDDVFDYSQDMATSRFNVQVRIGPNGETIIDEASLVVDRQEDVDTSDYTHVVESDTTKFINSGTYGKKCRGSRWSKEETETFYHALSQYGENYELLAFVMPGRDRKACKNKFKAEDKKNPARITYCLNNRIPVDMQTLSRMTGKDFSGPVPEIRVPTPAPIPVPPSEPANPPEVASTQNKSTVKKRSRSRSAAIADDVQILGSLDSFNPFPED